jgi:hypothetical protein
MTDEEPRWRLLRPVRRRAETPRDGLPSLRACVGVVVEKGEVWKEGIRKAGGIALVRRNAGPKAVIRRLRDEQCIVVGVRRCKMQEMWKKSSRSRIEVVNAVLGVLPQAYRNTKFGLSYRSPSTIDIAL